MQMLVSYARDEAKVGREQDDSDILGPYRTLSWEFGCW